MKASILDLRRRMSEVLQALDRSEPVTLLHRGKEKGVIYPASFQRERDQPAADHAAFGMWKDRGELQDVERLVRELRQGRFRAV